MDQRRVFPRLCFLLTASTALLGVVVRSVCFLCLFEKDIGYFESGILPALSDALYLVALIIPIVCASLTPRDALPRRLNASGRAIPAVLLGLALAAFTTVSLLICFPARRSNTMVAPSLLGLLASTYYFLSARKSDRYPDWLSLLGYLPVFWSITAIGETYFDTYTAMNSPVKLALQFGMMGFMLIALAELRFRVDRAVPRYSLVFLSIGSYVCLVGSIPVLVATGAGILNHLRHTLFATVLFCAGAYALYLLFRYVVSPVDTPDTPAPSDTAEDILTESPNNVE